MPQMTTVRESISEGSPVLRRSRRKKNGRVLRGIGRWIGRVFALIGTFFLIFALFVVGVVCVICKGPSKAASEVFVNSVMESSAAKFIAYIFYSDEEVEAILNKYSVVETEEVTLPDTTFDPLPEEEKGDILVEDVHGATFRGKMMIIRDPSRVVVGALEAYDGRPGKRTEEFCADAGAVAGVNGGGFEDEGGQGDGSLPIGIVIHDSQLLYEKWEEVPLVVGFDQNDVLVVGKMTGQQALDRGLRDALSFGPALIINGKMQNISGTGGGLNPRTAIGQRADGAVLLLVIDGRHANSMGATPKDCARIMWEYGAVNAANLDGGFSSIMVHEGEILSTLAPFYGSRPIPDCILVMPSSED
ncbi:MAG: phosphodiester glycosidase family protein [Clostridia bacterium]|nr:phosphodiester glycosidase family protein [Clostridia bacterium]